MYGKIILKRGKEESLKRFHPWVFSGALHSAEGNLEDGDLVKVFTHGGDFVAVGHFQRGTISVRVLSFSDEEIDFGFFKGRIGEALSLRRQSGLAGGNTGDTFRLVHGEGDRLPGLVVDCYGNTAVVQSHSAGMHRSRHEIARAIEEVMGGGIANVYYKSETTLTAGRDQGLQDGFLVGGGNCGNIGVENGLKFKVDWLKGQKTGFFIDQRENRSLLERYSHGESVLNMFCYTGGFSVYAMRGGAAKVHSVDSSAKAISITDENMALNFPGDNRHTSFCEDAFRFLSAPGEQYGTVVLDPPAFAKHRSSIRNALKGYIRLNAMGMGRVKPGGVLFTFSCSQVVSKDDFRNAVFTAAIHAGRRARILHQLHQPADHPVDVFHPEGEYLKGLVLRID